MHVVYVEVRVEPLQERVCSVPGCDCDCDGGSGSGSGLCWNWDWDRGEVRVGEGDIGGVMLLLASSLSVA